MSEASYLAENSYGKSGIRLVKVTRDGDDHTVRDWTVAVALEGAFEAAHTVGDNSAVLPTDTMKNTVYAKAREIQLNDAESFASALCRHFLGASANAERATVTIEEHGWRRLVVAGEPHGHAFERAGNERRVARVSLSRGAAPSVSAGISDLLILKSAHSAFSGYPRDAYTTLRETEDRILATSISAQWTYAEELLQYDEEFNAVRTVLLQAFSRHDSKSVQHTLYAMGAAVLETRSAVSGIHITMPNKHHLLVDLSAFNLDNPNEIFVPTNEPFGLIEATLRR